jgi:hypothetical protein
MKTVTRSHLFKNVEAKKMIRREAVYAKLVLANIGMENNGAKLTSRLLRNIN